MPHDVEKQLKKLGASTVVDSAWLVKTKRVLRAYMFQHPPVARPARINYFSRMVPAFLTIALLLVTTGVLSAAAQKSIPGDTLYPWKVGVVESVESAFVVSTQARAEFEVARTTKRLQEITQLTARNNASTEVVSSARKRLEEQIKVASASIEKAAEEDKEKALEIAVELGATLNAHQNVLTTIQNSIEGTPEPEVDSTLSAIKTTVENIQGTIETLKTQNQQTWALSKTEEELKTDAEVKLQEVQKRLDTAWGVLVELDEFSDLRFEGERGLTTAQEAILNAQDLIEQKLYEDALAEIQAGNQFISQVDALLQVAEDSDDSVKDVLTSPAPSILPSPTINPTPTPLLSPTPSPTPKAPDSLQKSI